LDRQTCRLVCQVHLFMEVLLLRLLWLGCCNSFGCVDMAAWKWLLGCCWLGLLGLALASWLGCMAVLGWLWLRGFGKCNNFCYGDGDGSASLIGYLLVSRTVPPTVSCVCLEPRSAKLSHGGFVGFVCLFRFFLSVGFGFLPGTP
jgi:hypothetical protein